MGKEKIIPIIAMVFLLIGITSSIYVYATTPDVSSYNIDDSTLIINNQQYTLEEIFSLVEKRTVLTPDGLNFSGVALNNLITLTGVDCPSCHEYNIVSADTYEKTVTWENMENGVLTEEGTVAFSDLAKAFRVKYVVKIEVI